MVPQQSRNITSRSNRGVLSRSDQVVTGQLVKWKSSSKQSCSSSSSKHLIILLERANALHIGCTVCWQGQLGQMLLHNLQAGLAGPARVAAHGARHYPATAAALAACTPALLLLLLPPRCQLCGPAGPAGCPDLAMLSGTQLQKKPASSRHRCHSCTGRSTSHDRGPQPLGRCVGAVGPGQ